TATVLAILVSGGLTSALNRYHFDAETPEAEQAVWWTGLSVVIGITTVIVLPALLLRNGLADFTLGPQETRGGFYYTFVLATLWFTVISQTASVYFRVRKWSWLTVNLSIGSLLMNICLNVYFLTVLHWGILGVLAGNLITLVVMSVVRLGIMVRTCGRFR